jgi:hypothetical protein
MPRKGRVEREHAGVDQPQDGVGEDRLRERGGVEDALRVDWGAGLHIADTGGRDLDSPVIADDRHRKAGHAGVGDELPNVVARGWCGHEAHFHWQRHEQSHEKVEPHRSFFLRQRIGDLPWRDDDSPNCHSALAYWWSMIFSENRYPLLGSCSSAGDWQSADNSKAGA